MALAMVKEHMEKWCMITKSTEVKVHQETPNHPNQLVFKPRSKLLRNRLGKALVMHCCMFGFGKRVDGVCIFLLLRLLYIVYWPMCSRRVDQ